MANGKKGGRNNNKNSYRPNNAYPRDQDFRPRRVKFEGRISRHRQRDADAKNMRLAPLMLDSDVDMGQNMSHGNDRNKYRQHRHTKQSPSFGRRLFVSPSGWYKAFIRGGEKYEKHFLLSVIENRVRQNVPFTPLAYHAGQEEVSFVIDNLKIAQALADADKRITMSDGFQLPIRVRPFMTMIDPDKPDVQAALKTVLAHRYSENPFKALDLTLFHMDKTFMDAGLFLPLNRSTIMTAVLQLIGDSVPDLVALNLSDNRLIRTEDMKIMIEKVPALKILHLERNRFRDIKCLDSLKGLPLAELVLTGNPFVNRVKEKDAYIRAVRERFPKVIKLDNDELPPPILFVDDESTPLPGCQASFMCDTTGAGASMARQFIEQYYHLFDNDRTALAQAYHPSAEFSLTVMGYGGSSGGETGGRGGPSGGGGGNGGGPSGERRIPPWNEYNPKNRNLLRNRGETRTRFLHKGRQAVVAALTTLPATLHDPASFVVDLAIFTPQIIELVIMGVFKEQNKKDVIRSFSRVFLLVPNEAGGFCIINEMLSLQNATEDQIRKAFKVETTLPAAALPVPVAVVGVPPAVGGPSLDIQTKQNMVTQLAAKTNMNLSWSEKCLNETAWNFDQALYAFNELHSKGAVPAEAFIS